MTPCIDHGYAGIRGGYAQKQIGKRMVYRHRLAYCEANGVTLDSIDGLDVRHKCDNPRCVRGDHLELGTHADNMLDMATRERVASTLTIAEAQYIVDNYKFRDKEFGGRALAAKFGVSPQTICDITKGRHFAHIKRKLHVQ